ncbi:hypothetical protein EV702DRAFT_1047734 [Suillus placidus]|uniref:Uncharacterized protein n=1 Tax=Suillus placidus TaxID=48579 RepID=A0A9P6ZPM4_9AGAM|nr:hypothetical protein EV702DRAFT_1047734 [Suillus placidus]
MSDNAGMTQTLSSNPTSEVQPASKVQHKFDQASVTKCLKLVDDFGKGLISKGDALLEIQLILQSAIGESDSLTQQDFKPGFTHFLQLLDHASGDLSSDKERGRNANEPERRESDLPSPRPCSSAIIKERELRSKLRRQNLSEEDESDESGDEHEYILRGKRRKLTSERLQFYPWLEPKQYRHVSHQKAEELTLDWRAPDLKKVLSGHYSTSIDPKQTQSLGKGFEITLSQPTTTHKVKTFGDWSIVTDLWIEALTFIMPWKEDELRSYKRYLSGFFIDVHYALHSRIIDFDKACRLKIEGQKYLRFDSISKFRHLKVSHLSSLGMVAYSELHQLGSTTGDKSSGKFTGGRKKSRFESSG